MEQSDHQAHAVAANSVCPVHTTFSRDVAGLPEATRTAQVELGHDEVFALRAIPVHKRVGDAMVKMLAYNGSAPGPTLRVAQGSEVTIIFTNETDVESTVHWHGLRLDNRFDGVPEGAHHGMQAPIPTGGRFTYHLRFPDAGLFWYHPHIREDDAQEHGLYGNIIVDPSDAAYWGPVNRELVLDDILIEDGMIAPFSQSQPNRTAMGRFGNVMLTNGETDYRAPVNRGEVVRLFITNTANVRVFNLRIPAAGRSRRSEGYLVDRRRPAGRRRARRGAGQTSPGMQARHRSAMPSVSSPRSASVEGSSEWLSSERASLAACTAGDHQSTKSTGGASDTTHHIIGVPAMRHMSERMKPYRARTRHDPFRHRRRLV